MEATGLEVDKLNRTYVKRFMDHYLDSYKDAVGGDFMGSRGIRFLTLDSWEIGLQNWTDDLLKEFVARRGYDPTPWMPVLAGRVVESGRQSDRFLWDFRKTLSDLVADAVLSVRVSSVSASSGSAGDDKTASSSPTTKGLPQKRR